MVDDGYSNLAELKLRLDTMTHRVSHTEANRYLPPKRRIVTYVAAKDQVKSGMVAEVRAAAKRGNEALREILFMEAAARKRRRLMEKIDADVEGGLKTVVFTGRRKDVDAILEAVTKRHGAAAMITGGHGAHSATEREAMRVAYMAAPGPAILVGTTDAWGEGLNLQDTDHLLVGLLPWTPGSIVQLEGRVVRLGQTRAVLIEYLIAEGTIDERIASLLLSKMPAVEKVIGQDEISGFASDLSGVDDADLVKTMAAKIIGGGREL
jgi:SNF2 family DNA or RNA helicase